MHNLLNSIPSLYTSRHAYPPCTAKALYAPYAVEMLRVSGVSWGGIKLGKTCFVLFFVFMLRVQVAFFGGFTITVKRLQRPKHKQSLGTREKEHSCFGTLIFGNIFFSFFFLL